ncbi:hypothetical protein MA5S0921_3037 [Mycobacteroides abscessus 5S-0921]|uniref:Uncharacterized protein n=1 Tax=Mycobacteroides abscessus subsp. bolletii 1513 TaxID=1299321 RepID=X8DU23_9MYCO|nr:hypothetical protein MA5S0304_2079 [Mycobacteroides abscessus 5S-0304]EIU22774.1 hypothetical protein MA5S0708_5101 [Mycobacteroides abscessus 5S-0708]EIU91552.1 hypothetical protein MA5S0921_3037 [Mycobacteroides abscessus 5S-0921]EUA72127.1 hypothetical protein I540_3246 [Mycobacteroides abscessus subsp. bolletii 1513]
MVTVLLAVSIPVNLTTHVVPSCEGADDGCLPMWINTAAREGTHQRAAVAATQAMDSGP